MPLWKQILLTLYYHASLPARAWTARRWAEAGRMPVVALFWHRIADDRANEWTTPTEVFFRQIRWLQKRFQFVPLEEAQRIVRGGENRLPRLCATFDDGYADNCRQAIPFLQAERIPFAYFVTVENVIKGQPFDHDLRRGQSFAPNTLEQLRAMAADGAEIGVHGYTHLDFGKVSDPETLRCEVVEAKRDLEQVLDRPVRYFAFPFGQRPNLSAAAFALARASGYAGACSAYGGFNFPGDDAFHLQRISADRSFPRMKNWVTFDPRKLRTPRFDPFATPTQGQRPDFHVNEDGTLKGDGPDLRPGENGTVPFTPVSLATLAGEIDVHAL